MYPLWPKEVREVAEVREVTEPTEEKRMVTHRKNLLSAVAIFVTAAADMMSLMCVTVAEGFEECSRFASRYIIDSEGEVRRVERTGVDGAEDVFHDSAVSHNPGTDREGINDMFSRGEPSRVIQEVMYRENSVAWTGGRRRWYAVVVGRRTGLYCTWFTAGKQVTGYSRAIQEKFVDKHEALQYMFGYFRSIGRIEDIVEYDANENEVHRHRYEDVFGPQQPMRR